MLIPRIRPLTFMPLVAAGAVASGCISDPNPNLFAHQLEYAQRIGLDTDGRDAVDYYRLAAEIETDPQRRGRFLRDLADALTRRSDPQGALQAYEQAALLGDRASGSRVLQAQAAGQYMPGDLEGIARTVYVPRARDEKSVSAALLLADLTGSGQLQAGEFRNSVFWLELAASYGSNSALTRLAGLAEARGDLAAASRLFSRANPEIPALRRALTQARRAFNGEDGRARDFKLAFAWLSFASRLDAAETAKVAARLYRDAADGANRERLAALAKAGGVDVLARDEDGDGAGGFLTRYRDAPTDADRAAILAEARRVADQSGNPDAAFAVARILSLASPDPVAEAFDYYALALRGGNARALPHLRDRLATMRPGDPGTDNYLRAIVGAADSGNVEAMLILSGFYASGGPVAQDIAESQSRLFQAADAGNADAQFRAGVLLSDPASPILDAARARRYLEAAAAQGNEAAASFLQGLDASTGQTQ